ncbi:helix-turn-helix domain-containing protein [Stenotrophomonas maltophilia]
MAKPHTMTTRLPANVDASQIPEMRKAFAKNFKAARIKAGLRQVDICEKAGMSQPYLSEVERGLSNISLDNMEILAALVDKPLWVLLKP